MTNDYHPQVAAQQVWVLVLNHEIIGVVVLVPKGDSLLLDNIAVLPSQQRQGWGRRLIDFAEYKARCIGCHEIRLYTNELMYENLAWYEKLGYRETARSFDSGFKRVFMKKNLSSE